MSAADRNDGFRGHNDDRIPSLSKAGRQCQAEIRVARLRVSPGQDPYGQPTGSVGPAASRFHNATSSTTDERGPALGQPSPDFLRELLFFFTGRSRTDHGDDGHSNGAFHFGLNLADASRV
jgi:hypothetical protein